MSFSETVCKNTETLEHTYLYHTALPPRALPARTGHGELLVRGGLVRVRVQRVLALVAHEVRLELVEELLQLPGVVRQLLDRRLLPA